MSYTEKLLKEFKNLVKELPDRNNRLIYVSDTISDYCINKIIGMIRKEVEDSIVDCELGVITGDEFEYETSLLRVIYKSLIYTQEHRNLV